MMVGRFVPSLFATLIWRNARVSDCLVCPYQGKKVASQQYDPTRSHFFLERTELRFQLSLIVNWGFLTELGQEVFWRMQRRWTSLDSKLCYQNTIDLFTGRLFTVHPARSRTVQCCWNPKTGQKVLCHLADVELKLHTSLFDVFIV